MLTSLLCHLDIFVQVTCVHLYIFLIRSMGDILPTSIFHVCFIIGIFCRLQNILNVMYNFTILCFRTLHQQFFVASLLLISFSEIFYWIQYSYDFA